MSNCLRWPISPRRGGRSAKPGLTCATINSHADYRDLLAIDAIDAVAITVPQQFRRGIVLDAFAAGQARAQREAHQPGADLSPMN